MAQPAPTGEIQPFADFLAALRDGATHDDLGLELHDLVEAVRSTGKPGTLTLVIKVSPAGRKIEIDDKVTVKTPQHDRETTAFHVTTDGNLTRRDPTQLEISIRLAEEANETTETIRKLRKRLRDDNTAPAPED